jgi:hypothetical protein
VEGLQLPDGQCVVYSGYADDTTLYLSGLNDLSKALPVFEKYSKVSGMKLNIGKCSIIPLGSLLDCNRVVILQLIVLTAGLRKIVS